MITDDPTIPKPITHLFDEKEPLEAASTIPSLWYHLENVADYERSVIFHDTWQMVGRVDQVTTPGSFFTADLAGEPILVVRGDDGKLRAFSNVCRHRAARV